MDVVRLDLGSRSLLLVLLLSFDSLPCKLDSYLLVCQRGIIIMPERIGGAAASIGLNILAVYFYQFRIICDGIIIFANPNISPGPKAVTCGSQGISVDG